MKIISATPKPIRFGNKAFLKLGSGRNHDQVRFPSAKATAPKKIN